LTHKEFLGLGLQRDDEIYIEISSQDTGIYIFSTISDQEIYKTSGDCQHKTRASGYKLTLYNESDPKPRYVALKKVKSIKLWRSLDIDEQEEILESFANAEIPDSGYTLFENDTSEGIIKYILSKIPKYQNGKKLTESERLEKVWSLFTCDGESGCRPCEFIDEIIENFRVGMNEKVADFGGKVIKNVKYFNSQMKFLEILSDYILGYQYSQDRLKHRYYDSRRRVNQTTNSDIAEIVENARNTEREQSDTEVIDSLAVTFNNGQYCDDLTGLPYFEALENNMDILIAHMDAQTRFKTDAELLLSHSISRQNLRTRRKHIRRNFIKCGLSPSYT